MNTYEIRNPNPAIPNKEAPIGIFDSGVGGLTVFRAIERRLPSESLIYLGDTARIPYGTPGPRSRTRSDSAGGAARGRKISQRIHRRDRDRRHGRQPSLRTGH